MRKIILSSVLLLLLFGFKQINAQRVCASTFNPEQVQQTDNQRYQRFLQLEQHILDYRNSLNNSTSEGRLINQNSTIIIPVVVHVIHNNGEAVGVGRNISVAQVQSQIDVLNEDFRRLNADRVNTPNAFIGVASDPNIEFRLSCVDPNGNPTNGITRTASSVTSFTDNDNIKFNSTGGHDAWPTNQYLNMWVGDLSGGLLGYGQFPFDYAQKPTTDGVVIRTTAFGRVGNVTAPFNTGRTATHEVGHWFDLFHIWGDDGNSCNGSDQCGDTPNQADENVGCPGFPSPSCNNNGDMSMNYMDYSDDACMNIYTNDQRIRMRAIFANGGPRAAFINNYFKIIQPTSPICNSGTITVSNPGCLPVTWLVVSGPATISGSGNSATILKTGDGIGIIRATAGGYIDETTVALGVVPVDAISITLPFADPDNLECATIYQAKRAVAASYGVTGFRWTINPEWAILTNPPTTATINFMPNDNNSSNGYLGLSVQNACGWSSEQVLFMHVACSSSYSMAVNPNPAESDIVTTIQPQGTEVEQQDKKITKIDFSLYDVYTNQVVKKWTVENGQKQYRLNAAGIKPGTYVLQAVIGKYKPAVKIFIK